MICTDHHLQSTPPKFGSTSRAGVNVARVGYSRVYIHKYILLLWLYTRVLNLLVRVVHTLGYTLVLIVNRVMLGAPEYVIPDTPYQNNPSSVSNIPRV